MKISKLQSDDFRIFNAVLLLEQILGARLFAKLCSVPKRKLLSRFQERLASGEVGRKISVDRRTNLSAAQFHQEYFSKSKPVVFAGAARDWKCCKKWDLDYFSTHHGDHDLLLVDAKGLTSRRDGADFEFLSVRELIQDIRRRGDKYLRFSPILHENPELVQDVDLGWLQSMRGDRTFASTYYMFMGGAGQKTLLHADQPCNLYVQIYGEKKWTLFMPDDSVFLYPEITNSPYVKSPLNIEEPDPARFPLFRYSTPLEAHLMPGDVLYVPPHVWHNVQNLTDTIAVGYRFSSLWAALRSSVAFTLIRALSTNPSIWKTMKYGKQDTNLIWADAGGNIPDVLKQWALRRKLPPIGK